MNVCAREREFVYVWVRGCGWCVSVWCVCVRVCACACVRVCGRALGAGGGCANGGRRRSGRGRGGIGGRVQCCSPLLTASSHPRPPRYRRDEADRRLRRNASDRASTKLGGGGRGLGGGERAPVLSLNDGDVSRLLSRTWDTRGQYPRVLAVVTLFESHKEAAQEIGQVVKSFLNPLEDIRMGATIGANGESTVKGTSSSLSATLYGARTAFKKSNTTVLRENPDVSVFLKTAMDMNKMYVQMLASMDNALHATIIGGRPLALGNSLSPVAERLFESYAWVVNSACKTVLSPTFKEFTKVSDAALSGLGRGATTESTLGRVLPHLSVCISGRKWGLEFRGKISRLSKPLRSLNPTP